MPRKVGKNAEHSDRFDQGFYQPGLPIQFVSVSGNCRDEVDPLVSHQRRGPL
jgi:hypothetical protein